MNRTILFYISGHGFGHATRMCAVLSELNTRYPDAALYIRTNAPRWIFDDALGNAFHFHALHIDTGTHQHDFIHLDKKQSLLNYENLIAERRVFLLNELDFIRKHAITLIVGDIPPAAFYIAHKAGIKSIGISNFSWDWIFAPYCQEYPQFSHIIDDMRRGYGYADLLLRLPFHGDFSAFPNVRDIPLIARPALSSPDTTRKKLRVNQEKRPIILCSFGGFAIKNFDFLEMTKKNTDFFFIGFHTQYQRGNNYLLLPYRSELNHPDLVNAADSVVAKLGYGTVSECIATHTPILYISRDDFVEYPVLEHAVKTYIPSRLIDKNIFFSGQWNTDLHNLLENSKTSGDFPRCASDGASKAAEILYSF
ncbi:hypothetical protein KDK77_06325 [bacterium]|nr:hypothetical protein [bacterium]MCP5462872.1 hypothetical protein [bacterium]